MTQSPFALLRSMTKPREPMERCELCGAPLGKGHSHLVEIASRRLACSCDPCAVLFCGQSSARYRRVPRDARRLENFQLDDALWESLHIPINLAYFHHATSLSRVVAMYPSPAGATESLLTLEAWLAIEDANPELRTMEPDVEALLVNRVGPVREHYLVPIDTCYRLVGILRKHWRGLSGGTEVWTEIAAFFRELKASSRG